tara:strand:- start:6 stop:491 length:486 start_codon:yes stop_codon:yes gene_type:complete
MVTVKVVYMDGRETEYQVEYPKAYIAKIMESQNELSFEQKNVKEIYTSGELTAVFTKGFSNELVLNKFRSKKTTNAFHDAYVDRHKPIAGMGRYKGHTVPDHIFVDPDFPEEAMLERHKDEEDWNAYQAEIIYAQKMLNDNAWVIDHTGGNVDLNYIPKSL